VRHRTGCRRLIVFEAFAATDGEIIIAAANDRLFRKLAVALGRPEWTEDERFTTNAQRLAHKDVLLPEIRAIVAREPSEHWVELLEAAGVPCAPVQDVKHAVAEPQAAALGMIADVPESGLSLIGLPLSFDGERPPMRRRAPELGEHNGELRRAKGKAAE
jgi:crotonobetainyl-CoA:carnitine CoA-transferase CaiB-like acyl-CoA transferase